jgi:hypothetical protein
MVNLFNRSTAAQWLLYTLSSPSGNSTEAGQSKTLRQNPAADACYPVLQAVLCGWACLSASNTCKLYCTHITKPNQFIPVLRKEPHCLSFVLRSRHFLQRLGYSTMSSAARQTTRVWSNQDSNRQRFGGMGRHSTPYGGSSVHNVGKPHGLCLVFIRSARPCSGAKGMVDIVAAPAREYIYEPLSMLNLSPTSCNLPRSARQELIYS